jgi:hypothetical protein
MNRRIAALERLLRAMQEGMSLHLYQGRAGDRWRTGDGKPVDSAVAQMTTKNINVIGVDCLFHDIPHRTFIYRPATKE